jgi:uncharacterized protein (DUF488 family)
MRVYSVGHSNLRADEFSSLRRDSGVTAIADVRRQPGSRRFPWFSRGRLAAALEEAGMTYLWLGEGLGGRKRPEAARSEAKPSEDQRIDQARGCNRALREPAFRALADAQGSHEFERDLALLLAQAGNSATAMLCAEADWKHCHRQILADVLVARGCEVLHLRRNVAPEPHVLSEAARVTAGRVSYPSLL